MNDTIRRAAAGEEATDDDLDPILARGNRNRSGEQRE